MFEMVSVAEEQSATVASLNKVGIPSAREVIKPERYRVQPPCVRLCIVDMKVKVIKKLFCCHASEPHSV